MGIAGTSDIFSEYDYTLITQRLERVIGPYNHPISCPAEGKIELDSALFYLWRLAQVYPLEQAAAIWSEIVKYPQWMGRVALEILGQAGILSFFVPPRAVSGDEFPFSEFPLVSIVIVNRNGREHLTTCLPSIAAQHYPNLEIIVVDNGSEDDSVRWLTETWPQVKILALEEDVGFAGANNRGIAQASGEYFFLLNNDTRLDPHTVEFLMARLSGEDRVGAVVPMIRLMSQPAFVNALGNAFRDHGWGGDNYIGYLDVGQLVTIRQVPAACFAAVLIPRTTYEVVGIMDEGYGYYYEDADWSWRARLHGFHILAEPRALVYHAFGGTSATRPWSYKLKLVARNRLRFILKNLSKRQARRFIVNYLREDIGAWRHARKIKDIDVARAYTTAWREVVQMLPNIYKQRHQIQNRRLIADEKILYEMEQIPPPRTKRGVPFLSLSHIVEDYGPYVSETGRMILFNQAEISSRRHILIIAPPAIETHAVGNDLRYQELAEILSQYVDVTLAVPNKTVVQNEKINLKIYDPKKPEILHALQKNVDIILLSPDVLVCSDFFEKIRIPIIVDFRTPFVLQNLGTFHIESESQHNEIPDAFLKTLIVQLKCGDFFICTSERQRDLCLGALLGLNRITSITCNRDQTLRHLVDVVPAQFCSEEAVNPLVNFCLNPRLATDHAATMMLRDLTRIHNPPPTPIHQLPGKAIKMLLEKGPGGLLSEISHYVLWRLEH
ncbi:MAG: glycosyltransferase family 2 protein [Anaerolineae bacterium]|nr:glycosyltransferase family 2 protein [Anaerolineae bacterium]